MSATQLIVTQYTQLRTNGAEFFDAMISSGYDFLGMYAIRKALLDPKAAPAASESSPLSVSSQQSSPASQHTIYVEKPEELSKDARKIMEGDNYKSAKDYCLHNFKIALFNIVTALIITKVFFMVIGISSITLPALGSLAVAAILRDMLVLSIDKDNENISTIGKILAKIDEKYFSGADWFGGNKAWGFFRTMTAFPKFRAAFLLH